MHYEPKMQEIIIKKQIVSDIMPAQVANMLGKMNHMSAQIINVLNDMDSVKKGITDFKEGYYAMEAEPPNGKQLQSKKKINLALEDLVAIEEEREKSAAEQLADREKVRLGKLDPEERKFRVEITKLFLENIKEFIERPIVVFEKELDSPFLPRIRLLSR